MSSHKKTLSNFNVLFFFPSDDSDPSPPLLNSFIHKGEIFFFTVYFKSLFGLVQHDVIKSPSPSLILYLFLHL